MLAQVGAESDKHTIEDIIDELARVLHAPGTARELVIRAGFPAADLPAFDTPRVFWSAVLRAAADGKTLGGVRAIVERAAMAFPGNHLFLGYTPSIAVASEPLGSRLDHVIDNRDASIGQQTIVQDNKTFGSTTVSPPNSGLPPSGQGSPDARPWPSRNTNTTAPAPVDVVVITAAEGEDTALLGPTSEDREDLAERPSLSSSRRDESGFAHAPLPTPPPMSVRLYNTTASQEWTIPVSPSNTLLEVVGKLKFILRKQPWTSPGVAKPGPAHQYRCYQSESETTPLSPHTTIAELTDRTSGIMISLNVEWFRAFRGDSTLYVR